MLLAILAFRSEGKVSAQLAIVRGFLNTPTPSFLAFVLPQPMERQLTDIKIDTCYLGDVLFAEDHHIGVN